MDLAPSDYAWEMAGMCYATRSPIHLNKLHITHLISSHLY